MGGLESIPRSLRHRARSLRAHHSPAAELRPALLDLGGSVHVLRSETEQERLHCLCAGVRRYHGRLRGRNGICSPGESVGMT